MPDITGDLFKRDSDFCVGSPYRATMVAYAINDDVKVCWDAVRCRDLEPRPRIRKISNGAFEFRSFLTDDDKGQLQHTPPRCNPFFTRRVPRHQKWSLAV